LIYLIVPRLDITFVDSVLSQYMQSWYSLHQLVGLLLVISWDIIKKVLNIWLYYRSFIWILWNILMLI